MASYNPFPIKGYESKELFCDREAEVQQLFSNVQNGIDTTLISPRRMGKTGLILRFFDFLSEDKNIETVYVDIYASRSLSDFIKLLAEAILLKFPEKTTIGERFLHFIKGFRPLIGFDPLSGQPQIQLAYQSIQEKEYTLQGLLKFLDEQKIRIIIAIDEFQQIAEYPERNMEALLRTYIQPLKNIRFIYCGSKKSMMVEMFSSAKRPFYASTQFLSLEKIDSDIYKAFIRQTLKDRKRIIDNDALEQILLWSKGHTYYTQSVCNTLFAFEESHITMDVVRKACLDLLKRNEPVFLQYRQLLTKAQWNFLIAVAKEQTVTQLTAQHFLASYGIGTPANSKRISSSLAEKELLLETTSRTETIWQVYDVFLSRWLEMEY
jgi:hypothetical protein